ncbi:MAG: hypothetical protein RLZZ126_547 [Pseudomonadota bacterium]|jgi:uncharacterized protein (DUF58 family)
MFQWLRSFVEFRKKIKAFSVSESSHSATENVATDVAPPDSARADAVLRKLEWSVLRRLDGMLQGDYRTLLRGAGVDLADLRGYQLHDDVRHIDWNVTARTGTPHVRVYTEDREMTAWFLLDLSPSMDFGSGDVRKRQMSQDFVAVLARLLTRHGNRVGALMYGAGVDTVVPAGSGRLHVLRIIQSMLRRPAPPGQAAKPQSTQLGDLLAAGAGMVKRRSTVFVVSDFISEPGWHKPLGQLAQRHEVIAVRLVDPVEMDIPDLGLITMRDAESGDQMLVDTHDPGFRARFYRIAAEREARLRQEFAQAGVDVLEVSTQDDLTESVLKFTTLRKQRNRVGAGGKLPAQLLRTA